MRYNSCGFVCPKHLKTRRVIRLVFCCKGGGIQRLKCLKANVGESAIWTKSILGVASKGILPVNNLVAD